MSKFSLDAYLQKLAIDVPSHGLAPDLSTLRALHRAHAFRVPFSSLDVVAWRDDFQLFTGDEDYLAYSMERILTAGLGGTCYDTNVLMMYALKAIGFEVELMQGRVVLMNPQAAKSHIVLRVMAEGRPYLFDLSLGVAGLMEPIPLEPSDEICQDYMRYRLEKTARGFAFTAKIQGEWKVCYTFSDQQDVNMMDVHLMSYGRAALEQSKPRAAMIASIFKSDGLVILAGDTLKKQLTLFKRTSNKDIVLIPKIDTDEELRAVCKEHFNIEVPSCKRTVLAN